MADPAGKLQIRIGPSGTAIDSSRPLGAARVLVGRPPAETARILPALFSVCATAQSAACVAALEQAQGLEPDPGVVALRRDLVEAETLREHLWRVLLDWPRLLNREPDVAAMARVMDAYGRLRGALTGAAAPFAPGMAKASPPDEAFARRAGLELEALVAGLVLGMEPAGWLGSVVGLDALARWCEGTETLPAGLLRRLLSEDRADLGRSPVVALPALDTGAALAELDARLAGPEADDFVARPTWGGGPRDASPLTRTLGSPLIQDLQARLGNGILTRLAAQLLEMARIARRIARGPETRRPCPDAEMPHEPIRVSAPGVGLAAVPAARGPLIHRVRIADARVADYRILAPTEWNFHPRGVVATGLDDLRARAGDPERTRLARLFIAAVDPCVDFDLVQA